MGCEIACAHSGAAIHSLCLRVFFFSSRRRHTRSDRDWSSDVCSSDLPTRPSQPTAIATPTPTQLPTPTPTPQMDTATLPVNLTRPLVLQDNQAKFTVTAEIGRASCRERV